jgi:hypothetical protein
MFRWIIGAAFALALYPAESGAVVYCKSAGVPKGCVARPPVALMGSAPALAELASHRGLASAHRASGCRHERARPIAEDPSTAPGSDRQSRAAAGLPCREPWPPLRVTVG